MDLRGPISKGRGRKGGRGRDGRRGERREGERRDERGGDGRGVLWSPKILKIDPGINEQPGRKHDASGQSKLTKA